MTFDHQTLSHAAFSIIRAAVFGERARVATWSLNSEPASDQEEIEQVLGRHQKPVRCRVVTKGRSANIVLEHSEGHHAFLGHSRYRTSRGGAGAV